MFWDNLFKKPENQNTIEKLIDYVRKLPDETDKENIINYLTFINNNERPNPFHNDTVLVNIIYYITTESLDFSYINDLTENFNKMVCDDATLNEYFKMLYSGILTAPKLFSYDIYSIFTNKNNYIEIANIMLKQNFSEDQITNIYNYIISISQYFALEEDLKKEIIDYLNHYEINSQPQMQEARINDAKKRMGIFAIDSTTLSIIDYKLTSLENSKESLQKANEDAEELINKIAKLLETMLEEAKKVKTTSLQELDTRCRGYLTDLQTTYLEYLKNKEDNLDYHLDIKTEELLNKLKTEASEINKIIKVVREGSDAQVLRISNEGDNIIRKIQTMIKDNEDLRRVIDDLYEPTVLVKELEQAKVQSNNGANVTVSSSPSPDITIFAKHQNQIPPVSKYLDPSISFVSRYNELVEKIKKNESQGKIYHQKIYEVLSSLMEGDNPYLIGPSGCGKSVMVSQLAEILGLDMIDMGRITDSSDIIGFSTVYGTLSPKNFFYCYKYGGISFFDEIDNSVPDAIITLNSFTSVDTNTSYTFPAGVQVMRHPNFRIIAAGNTDGSGANEDFSARDKIDESLMQRLTPFYINYDNKIEKEILKNYPDWYNFVVAFRYATDMYAKKKGLATVPGIFTTRDASLLKRYLDHQVKTTSQILDISFIQTKPNDYLKELNNRMDEYFEKNKPKSGEQILKLYRNRVDEILRTGGRY